MSVQKIKNIFTQEELNILNNAISYSKIPVDDNNNYVNYKSNSEGLGICEELGRLQFGGLKDLPQPINDKVINIVKNLLGKKLSLSHAMAVEYSSSYGIPNLPVHYDHDTHDLIINFQLLSNTQWSIGIDLEVYDLEDNSAIIFNGNEHTHWRPHKTFKDKEFIKMIFFRFKDIENPSDYSHLKYSIDDEIFKEMNEFRDSLKNV